MPELGDAQRLLWSHVRDVPDWPKPGILFWDLTPLMGDAQAFATVIDMLADALGQDDVDDVVGIEARGFPYGAALALRIGAGFVTLRKPGKLPRAVHAQEYDLEYASAALELHQDALTEGRRVVIVDDVLATGGTACAAIDLVRRTGASIAGLAVVLELRDLGGGDAVRARGVDLAALLSA